MKIAEQVMHTRICTKSCLGNCFHVGSMVEHRTESDLKMFVCLGRVLGKRQLLHRRLKKQFYYIKLELLGASVKKKKKKNG